jgi:diacylglycerol kinase (ATP)
MSACCPLLMNTRAGTLYTTPGQEQLKRMARKVGLELEIIQTRTPGEMQAALRRLVAAGAERVAVAGGDGTVAVAVQELAHTGTALGILSQGTFNNFAAVLRIPHNLPAALQTLRDGEVREIDLGRVGDRYFTESAGLGFFADGLALYGVGARKSFLRGLFVLTRLFLAFHSQTVRLVVDGEPRSERVLLCEVANTYRIAQAVPIAPEADVADGALNMVIFGDVRRRELIPHLRALRAQMHLDLPKVSSVAVREVRLESRRPRNVHCDDRIMGVTPCTIAVAPGPLKVLVDPTP